ncbi:MAG: hypothetical protein WBA12_07175 [Catalinimonas sp.]
MSSFNSARKTRKKSFLPWVLILVVVAALMWYLSDRTDGTTEVPNDMQNPDTERVEGDAGAE